MTSLCGDETMAALARDIAAGEGGQIGRIEELIGRHPEDARLHFLRGSLLIGEGRLIEAHEGLRRAVEIAPDFAIARFQLGFFQLTSGEADAALETWGRLDALPDGHYLRRFVDGLRCLIRDDLEGAVAALAEGVQLNQENPPLSRDMQLLIERCRPLLGRAGAESEEASSETALILRQFQSNPRPI